MRELLAFLLTFCLGIAPLGAQIMGTGHRTVYGGGASSGFVQEKDCAWYGGLGATESCQFNSSVGATHGVEILVSWQTITSTISSVVDQIPATYSNTAWASGANACGASGGNSLLYTLANSAGGSMTKKVTVAWSADPGFGSIQMIEAAGVATSSMVDVADCQRQGGTLTPASPSVTTTGVDFLAGFSFDTNASGGNAWSAGTPPAYTFVGSTNNIFGSEYFVQSASGTVTAHFNNIIGYGAPQTAIVGLKP